MAAQAQQVQQKVEYFVAQVSESHIRAWIRPRNSSWIYLDATLAFRLEATL